MILFSISKVVACCVMFLLLLPFFAVKFVLLKPIGQIFKNDAGDDLPLISMIFYSENAGTKPLFSTASIAGACSEESTASRGISVLRLTSSR